MLSALILNIFKAKKVSKITIHNTWRAPAQIIKTAQIGLKAFIFGRAAFFC